MNHHKWGRRSLDRLAAAHGDIRRFADACLRESPVDLTVLSVYRGEAEQNRAFDQGASKLRYPDSVHNQAQWVTRNDMLRRRNILEDQLERLPHDSDPDRWPINVRAIDLAPVDPRWEDMPMWFSLCGFFRHIAQAERIDIVSGLDWDGDWKFKGDQSFWDGPHWQLRDA
jgi:hypothetical protein